MNSSSSSVVRRALLVIAMLCLGGLAWALRFNLPLVTQPWLESAELRAIDARFNLRGPRPSRAVDPDAVTIERAKKQVTIVAMDGAIRELYAQNGVLPRSIHARLVEQLKRDGARAVIFDVLFVDPNRRDAQIDAQFARAVKAAGNVYLPFDDNASAPTPAPILAATRQKLALPIAARDANERVRLQPPYPALFEAMRGGGHVATKADADGKFRSAILLLENDAVYPHVALDAVAQVWGVPRAQIALQGGYLRVGEHLIGPLERRDLQRTVLDGQQARLENAGAAWMIPLDFLGGRDVMMQLTIPYQTALEGRAPDRIKDHVVIVGDYATGTPDLRPGPFDRNEMFLGVQTNATLIANLLDDDFLHPAPRALGLFLTLGCALIAGTLALALRPALSLPLAGGLGLGFLGASILAFESNILLEVTAPLLGMALSYGAMSVYHFNISDRSARENQATLLETQTLLGQIVNPRLAREMASSPAARLNLQIGARREISILFCDIRGFTPWSETQTPEEVKARLDEYFPTMCAICEDDFDGFIDKFIGDAIMVVWNAHKDHPDHAERAARAALSMQRALAEMNAAWRKRDIKEFQIGIGIASGAAIFGTFGAPGRKVQPTVLGDTVNLAARLESATKEYGPICVSQNTYDALGPEFVTHFAGEVAIKGKAAAHAIYVVEGVTKSHEAADNQLETEQLLNEYFKRS